MADVASLNEVEVADSGSKAEAAPASIEVEASKPGTSSQSPTKADVDDVKQAMQHMAAGRRNLLVQDYHAAEASLSQACEMFSKHYGETALECAEPCFYYGKALLELARLEAGVINNGLEGDESEEQNSTEEDDDEEDGDAEAAEGEGEEEAEGEGEEVDEPKAKEDTESIGSNEAGPSSAKETKDVSATEAEDEEDLSNLQRAWEMLEMSKLIYVRHLETLDDAAPNKSALEIKLSDTYETLGEVSIENEDYPHAIEDLTTSLKLRQKLLPEDSRLIAETHYQLGVAKGFNCEFESAVQALEAAIGVLEKRIENLKNSTESKDPSKADDAFYSREREIEEIVALIPEIKEKIQDTRDMETESLKKIGDKKEEENGISKANGNGTTAPTNGDSGSTTNISHLVKKRKKSESEADAGSGNAENGDLAKKPHVEAVAANGNGHANGN